jgi:hypothetical protein
VETFSVRATYPNCCTLLLAILTISEWNNAHNGSICIKIHISWVQSVSYLSVSLMISRSTLMVKNHISQAYKPIDKLVLYKQYKRQCSASKTMVTIVWNDVRVIHIDFLPCGTITPSCCYSVHMWVSLLEKTKFCEME